MEAHECRIIPKVWKGNIIKNGTMRDYIGIENEGSNINIVTIFNKFIYFLNNELIYKEDKSGGD